MDPWEDEVLEPMAFVGVRLPYELIEEIDRYGAGQTWSRSRWIRWALQRAVAAAEKRGDRRGGK